MNVKKMFLIGLASLGMLLACDKENDVVPENNPTVAQDGKNYFVLDFQSYVSSGDTVVEVFFSASDMSEIPLLVVNGDTAKDYYLYGSMTYLVESFPYAEYLEYSISSRGKTTSGGIAMSKTPQLSCNGIVLESVWSWDMDDADTIPLADQYDFTWMSADHADYYSFQSQVYGYNSSGREYIRGNSKQLALESNEIIRLSFTAYSGALIQPGARPNVTGAYGDGYVTATSFTIRPYLIIPEDTDDTFDFKSSTVSEKQEAITRQPYTIDEVLRIVNQ